MFKNKDLKQLQKTQSLIKHYKASIEKLKSPESESYEIRHHAYKVLRPLLWGERLDPDDFIFMSDASIDYISQIGQYLMNITNYIDTRKIYDKELERLQKEERILKEKLGIE